MIELLGGMIGSIIISIIIGLIIGLVYALILKSQLTSVRANNTASDYTKEGSFSLRTNKDIFLGTKTERTKKPKSNN